MTNLENTDNNIAARAENRISRRDFVTLGWKGLLWISGLLGLGGLWRFFSFNPFPPEPKIFDLGPVDELPRNALITVSEANAVVLSTDNSFTAFSTVCPHLGCIVEALEEGFTCPCHNSRFALDGEVINGPAAEPLRKLKLEITEQGHLLVDIS